MKIIDLDKLPSFPQIAAGNKEPAASSESGKPSFMEVLNQALGKVNDLDIEADGLMEKMATGEATSIHQVMVGITKAEMALQFVIELRNKLTELYKEIMRMPV